MRKRNYSLLIVIVMMISMAPALMADDTAYIMYADSAWTYQYWGDPVDSGIVANNATVTGAGDYTVGLDFTKTEAGAASGLAFTALGIKTGEQTFPGYFIEITSIKVNGSEIGHKKGYTSSDDGITTRMNVYNEWVSELPPDARSHDGDISDAAAIIVEKADFDSVKTVQIAFTLHEGVGDTAYLMYADGSWTYQYWGDAADKGIAAKTRTVTGPGNYTVGLDFTGTETGAASGVAFTAVGIKTGEQTFPGYFIEITSIKVNGAEIELKKGYTSSDDGITTRMNIYNEWVSELPSDARSFDGDISDAAAVIVDKTAFESVKTVEVAFTVHEGLGDSAYIMYADGSWTYQYWGGVPENSISAKNSTITGDGSYTVGLDFGNTKTGAAEGLSFAAVGIATGEKTFPGSFIDIKSIKVNGEEVAFKKGYTSSDDGITTRMNIMNEWVAELPEDARSADGDISDASWIMVDKEAFASVKSLEVTFDFTMGEAAASGKAADEIDVEAALAAEYNAYFGVQTVNYIFRNMWDEASYGKESPNWGHLTGWGDDSEEVDYGGSFKDAVITGNGTYTVSLKLGDKGFGDDESFNMLFVSTDIPKQLIKDGLVTISDVKTSMDGGQARDFTYIDVKEGKYATISVMNTYNNAVGVDTIPYTMPAKSIDITFTISGFAKDAAAGGLPAWALILIIIGSVAVVAVVVIVILKSKKKN